MNKFDRGDEDPVPVHDLDVTIMLAQFDSINAQFSVCAESDDSDDEEDEPPADVGASSSSNNVLDENARFLSFGLKLIRGDDSVGHHLEAGRSFEPGEVLLRESAVVLVRFDEEFSALEASLLRHFKLSKIAPPYRLLARVIEHHGRAAAAGSSSSGSGSSSSSATADGTSAALLDPASDLMKMCANLDVATSKWPAAFCAFLSEAATAEGIALDAALVTRMLAIIK